MALLRRLPTFVAAAALAAMLPACNCGGPVVLPDAGQDAGDVDAGSPDAGDEPDAGEPDGGGIPDGGALRCSSCHGSAANSAPPRDVDGGTSQGLRTVGAHQAHLRTSNWHRAGVCEDCHVVPVQVEDPGHIDPSPAEMVYGPVASAGGAVPDWNGATCTNWCHGQKLAGGALTEPVWTKFDTAQAYCGDCHGVPPPLPHPQGLGTDCGQCHPNAGPGLSFVEPERHVDGVLDVSVACNACHGDLTSNAPPRDTSGNTATSARGVGAHRAHLGPSTWHAELQCTDCHLVPQALDDPGHVDTPLPAELTWSSLANARGGSSQFDGTTCTNTYCHGSSSIGGSNKSPTWTGVGQGQADCGTCHATPPGGTHSTDNRCEICHAAVAGPGMTIINPALHINGLVESSYSCGDCHALPPPTGAHLVHSALAPPTYGSVSTAASLSNPTGYAFGCGHCHPVNSVKHMSGGLADIELYAPDAGSLKGLTPASAFYTPGSVTLTDDAGFQYTEGTCGNVYCHSGPSYATPSGVPVPGVDFNFTGYPISYPPYALNVGRTYRTIAWTGANPGCTGCHGAPITTASPGVAAMAGQSHAWMDPQGNQSGHAWSHNLGAPLSCRTCHAQSVTAANTTARDGGVGVYAPVPITGFGRHVNGRPDVVFDTVNPVSLRTPKSLASATFSQATSTCNNVSCHLQQTAVKNGNPFRWNVSVECNACHQY